MKKLIHYIIIIVLSWNILSLNAQNEGIKTKKYASLTSFIEGSDAKLPQAKVTKLRQKVGDFIALQKQKKAEIRSEIRFLRQLDRNIHKHFLKNYKHFSPFTEMLQTGNFDCLSGVIFYGLVLERLGYDYIIYQTNFHVYLMIKNQKRDILIETTDPIYGFVDNSYYIQKRKKEYEKTIEDFENQGDYYVTEHRLHQPTSFRELFALQYYNQAVQYYNKRDLAKASDFLKKSDEIYPSKRTKELRELINFYASQISRK